MNVYQIIWKRKGWRWLILLNVISAFFVPIEADQFKIPLGVHAFAVLMCWVVGWFICQITKLNLRIGYSVKFGSEMMISFSVSMFAVMLILTLRSVGSEEWLCMLTGLLQSIVMMISINRFMPREAIR